MLWIGAPIFCLNVPGFQRQVFKHAPKCKWIPLKKFPWIPPANTWNVNFVGPLLVLCRVRQRANFGSVSGFRKCKWIQQKSGFRKIMRIPLTIWEIRWQFVDLAFKLRIPPTVADSTTTQFYKTHILLFDYAFHKLFRIPQILVRV